MNQSVVLLASYFASGVSQLFRSAIKVALDAGPSETLRKHELKLPVAEAVSMAGNLTELIPDLVTESPDISFQDTKSIMRVFDNYFEVKIPRDEITNNVSVGLALRHVLVHNGGVVDRKCLRQIAHSTPRSFRITVEHDQELRFATEEVEALGDSMIAYVERIAKLVDVAVSDEGATETQEG